MCLRAQLQLLIMEFAKRTEIRRYAYQHPRASIHHIHGDADDVVQQCWGGSNHRGTQLAYQYMGLKKGILCTF